ELCNGRRLAFDSQDLFHTRFAPDPRWNSVSCRTDDMAQAAQKTAIVPPNRDGGPNQGGAAPSGNALKSGDGHHRERLRPCAKRVRVEKLDCDVAAGASTTNARSGIQSRPASDERRRNRA